MTALVLATRKAALTPVQDLNHFIHGSAGPVALGIAIVLLVLIGLSSARNRG